MKQLKSLEQHNAERQNYENNQPIPNGIECPCCGLELMDSRPKETLTTYPPQKSVHCPNCDFKGYRVA